MAVTGLAQDDRFQRHLNGPGHPECPDRLAHIAAVLENRGLTTACTKIEVSPIDMRLVGLIHSESYTERLKRACADGLPYIDAPDSGICRESYEVARLAAGTVINAVDAVMAGRVDNAFCVLSVECFRHPRTLRGVEARGRRVREGWGRILDLP